MTRWHLDILALDRADAVGQIVWSKLPQSAKRHLAALVAGEHYTHTGRDNPDTPFCLLGSGTDHGSYVAIDRASIKYLGGDGRNP